jgi:hypothetical protein
MIRLDQIKMGLYTGNKKPAAILDNEEIYFETLFLKIFKTKSNLGYKKENKKNI